MDIDAKALAKEHARQAKNCELGKEDQENNNEQLEMGAHHLYHLNQFIEAVHKRNPDEAHVHMMNYAKSVHAKPNSKGEN